MRIAEAIRILIENDRATFEEMQDKIDLFYLMGRLTGDEYLSLCNKEGYRLNRIDDHTVELTKDEDYVAPSGEYINPIPFVEGMEVEAGKFYSFADGDIWEALKSGGPAENNGVWFGIIKV